MMIKNNDESVEINHNPNWPFYLGQPDRTLIIRGWGSGKRSVLRKLIKHQKPDVEKSDLYVKDPFDWKYQPLINENEKGGIKKLIKI